MIVTISKLLGRKKVTTIDEKNQWMYDQLVKFNLMADGEKNFYVPEIWNTPWRGTCTGGLFYEPFDTKFLKACYEKKKKEPNFFELEHDPNSNLREVVDALMLYDPVEAEPALFTKARKMCRASLRYTCCPKCDSNNSAERMIANR